MRGWTAWALTGVALSLAILIATCLIGVARLFPRLSLRVARCGLAAVVLRVVCQAAAGWCLPRRE